MTKTCDAVAHDQLAGSGCLTRDCSTSNCSADACSVVWRRVAEYALGDAQEVEHLCDSEQRRDDGDTTRRAFVERQRTLCT